MSARKKSRRSAPEEVSFAAAKEDAVSQKQKEIISRKSQAEAKKNKRKLQAARREQESSKAIQITNRKPNKNPKEKNARRKSNDKTPQQESPLDPLPLSVIQEAEDLRAIESQQQSESLKRKLGDAEFDDLDEDDLAMLEALGEEDLNPAPTKKTRKSMGMFEVVSHKESTIGEINPKVSAFLNNHFWGERIPRMDLNRFRSERVTYGPAKEFMVDES